MNPWPWKRLRDFRGRTRLAAGMKKVGLVLTILSVLVSPLGLILHGASYARWRWVNDNWYSRPLMLGAVGALGTYALQRSADGGLIGFYDRTLTQMGEPGGIAGSVTSWILLGTFPALLMCTLHGLGLALSYEHAHKVWIRPMRSNLSMKLRERVNAHRISNDASSGKGRLIFGLHAGDTLPWGDGRRGAVVSRPFKKIGHGFILGQQGSGKTALALNLADQFIANGLSLAFPDFKGDSVTCASLHASAVSAGVPFYAFSFTRLNGYTNVHYDPLGWEGSSNDKAALIIKALPFPAEDSAANYYRIKAEAYLPLQFDVLEKVGLAEGEGTFDFLLATVEPNNLINRMAPLRGNPETADLYKRWHTAISGHSAGDLEGLRGNLAKVVNSGGKYLRPATGDGINLDLRKVLDEGAVIYFELPSTLDAVSSITMGTLLMQDIKAIIGQRAKAADKSFRDVILMSDEASALGVRADIMDDISKQGRSSKIWNWTITQSIVTWPETTRREVVNNATVRVVFNMQEGESQLLLTEGMPMSYYLSVRKGFDMGDSLMGESSHNSGRGGTEEIMEDKQLKPGQIGSLPNRRAWIWVSGGDDGVKLVQGRARKRTLPWRDEAPSDVVVIKPVLRNRVAEILSGATPAPQAAPVEIPAHVEGTALESTPADWVPEQLPAPPAVSAGPVGRLSGTPSPAFEGGHPVVDTPEADYEAEPGSQPLSVILSQRKQAKAEPVVDAPPVQPMETAPAPEPRPVRQASPAPAPRPAPAAQARNPLLPPLVQTPPVVAETPAPLEGTEVPGTAPSPAAPASDDDEYPDDKNPWMRSGKNPFV